MQKHILICHGISREIVPGHFVGILRPVGVCAHSGFWGVHRNSVFIVMSESEERRKVKDQTRACVLQRNYNRIPGGVVV